MINKSKLLYALYLTKNMIFIIMKILIEKKEMIALINKKEINTIIIILIKKIKNFLKTKCKFNLKENIIEKIFVNIKRNFLKINTFEIEDNVKSYLIMNK